MYIIIIMCLGFFFPFSCFTLGERKTVKTWSHRSREGAGRSSRTAMSKALKGFPKGKKQDKSALAVVSHLGPKDSPVHHASRALSAVFILHGDVG